MSLAVDLSTLTTIPVSAIDKLLDKEELCVCHKVFENIQKGESITSVDIGIGTLLIQHLGDELRYKFIPARSLEENLKKVINNNEDILIKEVEDALKERITNAYKDLF